MIHFKRPDPKTYDNRVLWFGIEFVQTYHSHFDFEDKLVLSFMTQVWKIKAKLWMLIIFIKIMKS